MTETLAVLGSIICLISLLAIAFPQRLLRAAQKVTISTPLRLMAFAVRILLGTIVILAARSSRYPLPLKIIGGLFIVSGVMALLLSNSKIQSIMDWGLDRGRNSVRAGGIAGLLFGGFIVYAAVLKRR